MAVLSDKGLTCSNSLCRQRDFLPFNCNKCGNVFCLEHYLPDDHSCPRKNAGDRRVYVCPTCLEVVGLMDLETDEAAAVRHRPQCRPELRAQREKIKKGRKCPVNGCKERLTAISSIHCPHCQADICIKHRLKEDHNCELLKATRKERKRSSLFRQISSASRGVKSKGNSYPSNTDYQMDHKVRPWVARYFVEHSVWNVGLKPLRASCNAYALFRKRGAACARSCDRSYRLRHRPSMSHHQSVSCQRGTHLQSRKQHL